MAMQSAGDTLNKQFSQATDCRTLRDMWGIDAGPILSLPFNYNRIVREKHMQATSS